MGYVSFSHDLHLDFWHLLPLLQRHDCASGNPQLEPTSLHFPSSNHDSSPTCDLVADPPPMPAPLSATASWHCGSHPRFYGSRSPSRRTSSWWTCSSWRWGRGRGPCHHTLGSPSPSPPKRVSPRRCRALKTPSPTSLYLAVAKRCLLRALTVDVGWKRALFVC